MIIGPGLIRAFGVGIIPGLDTDALAIITAMVPTPDATRQTAINTMVVALKAASVWAPLGVLYVFAAHSSQASLLNWKAPTGTAALATNSPTFTIDRGWSGDGVAAFIDTQQVWSSITGVAQDNAHLGIYAAFGGAQGSGTAGLTSGAQGVSLARGSNTLGTRLNNTALNTSVATGVPATAGTHLVAARSLAASYDTYVDGVAFEVATQVSAAPITANLAGLRNQGAYAPSTTSLRALHAGPNLTATDVANVRSALQAYMVTVGAS